MYTDPIADFLTRIRNASLAGHKIVDIPSSKIKFEITKILFDQGYVLSYKHEKTKNGQGNIKIALKYNSQSNEPIIKKIHRISTPGLRKYSG
jgi:small subunit ribosomal protein S8